MSRMERVEQRRIIEAVVLASPEPISAARLAEILPYGKPGLAKELVSELNSEYEEQGRAFEIWEVAGGFQIRTRAEFSGYLQKLQKQRPLRLSRAALETLSIVAYKQPVTRGEIEQVRGVESGPVVKSLLERQLIKIAGQREVPGRPMVYATTRRFLEVFGLESLKALPPLRELEELVRELDAAAAREAESGEGPQEDDGRDGASEAAGEDEAALEAEDIVEIEEAGAQEAVGQLEASELEAGGIQASGLEGLGQASQDGHAGEAFSGEAPDDGSEAGAGERSDAVSAGAAGREEGALAEEDDGEPQPG